MRKQNPEVNSFDIKVKQILEVTVIQHYLQFILYEGLHAINPFKCNINKYDHQMIRLCSNDGTRVLIMLGYTRLLQNIWSNDALNPVCHVNESGLYDLSWSTKYQVTPSIVVTYMIVRLLVWVDDE